jgi:hypothetical protein
MSFQMARLSKINQRGHLNSCRGNKKANDATLD